MHTTVAMVNMICLGFAPAVKDGILNKTNDLTSIPIWFCIVIHLSEYVLIHTLILKTVSKFCLWVAYKRLCYYVHRVPGSSYKML